MGHEVTNIPPEFDRYSTPSELLQACQDRPIPGYPLPEDRWHISISEWESMSRTGIITVPDGPWIVAGHPNRERDAAKNVVMDPANPAEIDPAKKMAWKNEYDLVTDQGLPVHPMARLGLTTEIFSGENDILHKLGMATGIGRERHYGALNTGALLLARLGLDGEIEYPVVTELRGEKLRRSFPGGYAEIGEKIIETCIREANEELGIVDAVEQAKVPWDGIQALPSELWKISPSITGPCTLNVWLSENFLAIDATRISDMQAVNLQAGESGIKQALWCPGRELAVDPTLLGSHRRALLAHMKALGAK